MDYVPSPDLVVAKERISSPKMEHATAFFLNKLASPTGSSVKHTAADMDRRLPTGTIRVGANGVESISPPSHAPFNLSMPQSIGFPPH